MNNSFKVLKRNNFFYNYFLNKKILQATKELSDEELLQRIICLAEFSWRNHSGYYSDGRIENILFEYGRNLGKYIDQKRVDNNIKRIFSGKNDYTILHVATELHEVGGHTRMLYQFLKRYRDGNQLLILSGQSLRNIPKWFINGIGSNITIITLDPIDSLFERSYILRHISNFSRKVITYHHPHDVVPVMAFSHDKCPPILIENHAHSWFWLGLSIADLVFTHSDFHKDFTLRVRPVNNAYFLPSTDTDDLAISFDWEDKVKAKEKLKINPDTICIITVGTSEKFIPNSNYDFFKTAEKIVKRFTNSEIFVIGISKDSYLNRHYNLSTEKIHLLGPVSDLTDYYKAADIYLESLPQPSTGATLTSTPIGMCCPLLKYGAGTVFSTISAIESTLYEKYIGHLENEEEYLDKLEFLINDPNARFEIAREIRENYIRSHSSNVIDRHMREMLELTDDIKHSPKRIPAGFYFCDGVSAEIAGNSALQNLDGVIWHFEKFLNIRDKIAIISLLSTQLIHWIDILRYLLTWSRNRIASITR